MTITRRLSILAISAAFAATMTFADHSVHHSGMFQGPKANTGSVEHTMEGGKQVLKLSSDFVIPDTPAPTWRVIDSKGNTYTLQALKVKSGLDNRRIELPGYIKDVAKVQIWCAFAEVVLGETSFKMPVK
ncbi:MAG: hypothetical protein U0Q16_19915 [Bryobacteraceae bacterium]